MFLVSRKSKECSLPGGALGSTVLTSQCQLTEVVRAPIRRAGRYMSEKQRNKKLLP